ncbi:CMGC family protein kinase [Tritrichomonas foetus]|uniref:CMGC family protein kinase n=1 Tax=Tritrichomonas foetus TaxID=1144522 RepID=A0A1J4JB05_9EUKA|nr:CMGC family protein kinase [Tritrichomonas foetus]|eukprot:OHS96358.1 CMGC family protein kinase [Tritrichomonas foetus]
MNQAPRVPLTDNPTPVQPRSPDNAYYDLIVFSNDIITDSDGNNFQVVEKLGQGQFGQVFKVVQLPQLCSQADQQSQSPHVFAMKVTKSHTRYRQQAEHEEKMLTHIRDNTPDDEMQHISRIISSFVYRNHVIIIIELLSIDLFQVIQLRNYRGLPLQLIQSTLRDLLGVLLTLGRVGVIHSDIKPENILLADGFSASVKLIDFGSARLLSQPCSFYIQSRYYRAPEVVLAIPHGFSIDIWSIACVAFELFVGMPLLPGQSEIHLLELIVDMFGQFPPEVVAASPRRHQLFNQDGTLKTEIEICRQIGQQPVSFQPYFTYRTLPEIAMAYQYSDKLSAEAKQRERRNREMFVDLLMRMLALNPEQRATPEEALEHPFITSDLSE